MKTSLTILKPTIILCSIFATTAVFGQMTYTWTNSAGGDLAGSTNWNPNGVPNPNDANVGDTMQFDGQSSGPVAATSNTGAQVGYSGGAWGLKVHLTSNQTSPVNFYTTVANAASPGIRFSDITIDSAAGSFSLGNSSTTNALDTIWGGMAGQTHTWVNNSTNPATIYPNARWRFGGGGVHNFVFDGSGNWIVNNYLIQVEGVTSVQKSGSGTMLWTGANVLYSQGNGYIISPVIISGGTLILKSSDLLNTQNITHNGTLLEYDAPVGACTLSGVVSGTGALQVNNGTLTLSGANTYTGNVELNNGELIVSNVENAGVSGPLGVGGTIVFTGGTLGFSGSDIFDYSPRFSTAASQAYSFDTGGQNVTLTNGLTSSGGTLNKLGAGTLTLSSTSTYTGLTTVSGGELVFQGSKTGSGNIAVADSAALGVTENGSQITPATLTLGTSSDCALEFNNVNSTTLAPLAAGTLSSAGTVTVNINSGTFAPGNCYPLLTWTNGLAPAVSPGILNGAGGYLSISGHTLYLCITSVALVWTGVNSGNWTDPNNWTQTGIPITYFDPSPAVFDDTASGTTTVIVDAPVHPASVTVNNSTKTYSITSSGGNNIVSSAKLTKSGSGLLTLSGGANTYTGVTTISGGTLSVGALANGGSASDIGAASSSAANLVLNGGMLQYIGGGVSIDRLFTLTTAGGTIDSSGFGALNLNNSGSSGYSGNGPRTLTLAGTDTDNNTLAAVLSDNGDATALTKNGAGKWVLTANNMYSGVTTINNGVLQIGAGGASGSPGSGNIVDSGALVFNRSGSLTVNSVISGNGSVTNMGSGTVILAANNTYQGGTTISNGATLQVGNGGATGSLYINGAIDDEGLLIFNTTSQFIYTAGGLISGAGNVIVTGFGDWVKAIGANSYTGWTRIDSGATFQPCDGNIGQFVSSVVTNYGTLLFVRQDNGFFIYGGNIVGTGSVVKDVNNFNPGDVTLTGTNTYTGGTIIRGGGIILGDGGTPGWGSIVGNVTFTNSAVDDRGGRFLQFNRPDNFTFSGNIIGTTIPTTGFNQGDLGSVRQVGPNVVTLTGNNTYQGGTIISNGVLQVGNGGATGSIGSSNVTDESVLAFNRSDIVTFGGVISGAGSLVQQGSGKLTLTATNTYTGATTVSNGTLVVSSVGGDMNVSGGTLVPVGVGSIGTLTVAGNMNISAGTVVATLNRSASPSSTEFAVTGTISYTGGTLKLLSYGPALVVGDTFTVFNKTVTGDAGMPILSPGFTVVNNGDGTFTVNSVAAPGSGVITAAVSGGNLNLSWPAIWTGLHVQVQTNNLATGLSSNWITIPGTDAGNSYLTPLNNTNGCVFYRLAP